MRVRFLPPPPAEPDRDAGLQLHHAPAQRPRRQGGWLVLLALVCLAAALAAIAGSTICH